MLAYLGILGMTCELQVEPKGSKAERIPYMKCLYEAMLDLHVLGL